MPLPQVRARTWMTAHSGEVCDTNLNNSTLSEIRARLPEKQAWKSSRKTVQFAISEIPDIALI
ncbi:MAG TPA: hypothetical protein VGL34_05010 [Steroidobacteraceae bacterium]